MKIYFLKKDHDFQIFCKFSHLKITCYTVDSHMAMYVAMRVPRFSYTSQCDCAFLYSLASYVWSVAKWSIASYMQYCMQ